MSKRGYDKRFLVTPAPAMNAPQRPAWLGFRSKSGASWHPIAALVRQRRESLVIWNNLEPVIWGVSISSHLLSEFDGIAK
jgi:hypothetical protein